VPSTWRYAGLAMAAQAVQMACSIVALRWVPPEQMGIWLALLLAESYAQAVRLGVINSVNRQYPFLLGQGETAAAIHVVRVGWLHASVCAGLLLIGFALAALSPIGRASGGQEWVVLSYGIFAAANTLRTFLEGTYRGGQDFARLAIINWVGILLQIGSLSLVVSFGFKGFCLRAVALAVITALLCYAWRPVRGPAMWSGKIWASLVHTGWPLFISNYVTAFGTNLPRLLLVYYGSVASLGLFAPLAGVLALSTTISGSLLVYFAPRQHYEFGRDGDVAAVVRCYWRASAQVTCALVPIAILSWLVIPLLVARFLPTYADSVAGLRWAAVSAALAGLRVATSAFSTLQAWRPMYVFIAIQTGALAVFPWLALHYFDGDILTLLMQGVVVAQVVAVAAGYFCLRQVVQITNGPQIPLQ